MEVVNELGWFLHIRPKMLVGEDKRVGRVLVELDTHKGFSKTWR